MRNGFGSWFLLLIVGIICSQGCGGGSNVLTIYTSVDQDYAMPIIDAFQEANPDLVVNTVTDTELTKTTGIFMRIRDERQNPQADVFWNSEIVRTIQLKDEGLLAPYRSPSANDIPEQFKDQDGYWTGFSGRVRVMIVNLELDPLKETQTNTPFIQLPLRGNNIMDLASPRMKGKTGIAQPQFGTTAGHMAAIYTTKGEMNFSSILTSLKNNDVQILPGNASVRDAVVNGTLAFGLTDSDDALAAINEKKPVRMEILDQHSQGTLFIPNTVALINDSPNPEAGKRFIDYLLTPEVEQKLAESRARQIPVRASVSRPADVPNLSEIKIMKVNYEEMARNIDATLGLVRAVFK